MAKNKGIEIFKDVKFNHRFGLKGFDSKLTGQNVLGEIRWKGAKSDAYWTLAEWASPYLLKDGMNEEILEDGINFCNEGKSVKIYPGKGQISLAEFTSKEYKWPRKPSESWIHLLLEQKIENTDRISLDSMEHLYLELEFEVGFCKNCMSEKEYDTGLHAAQVSWYFTVENGKSERIDFEGRPDYYWFGLPLYDNRFNMMEGPTVAYDGGTEKLIYAMNRRDYIEGPVEIGKTYSFKIDVLKDLKHAFELTQTKGWMRGANWEDLAIGSTNLGWELPGTFDVEFIIKKLNVTCDLKD